MFTVIKVSQKLGVNPETVRRWIRAGKLQTKQEGQEHFITEEALEAFLRQNPKYSRFSLRTADREDVLIAFKQRLNTLETVSNGLKYQQDYIQAEITAMKRDLAEYERSQKYVR